MSKLSISRAWEETKDILRRDGSLLATVAAALLLLPQTIAGVFVGQGVKAEESPWIGLMLLAALIAMVGQLAISWLALGGRSSVGEAIRHGVRRFLPFFGAALIMLLVVFVILVVSAVILMAAGAVTTDATRLTGADVVYVLLLAMIPMVFISVRLLATLPVAAAEKGGSIAVLKRSWRLSAGHFPRLLAFVLLFLIAALVLVMAVGAIGGLLTRLVFGDADAFTMGALVLALLNGIVQAGLVLVYVVMLTRIYAQLAGEGAAEVSVPSSAD